MIIAKQIFPCRQIFRRVLALLALISMAMANTAGPNAPASAAIVGTGAAWSNPTNALANDGIFASVSVPTSTTSTKLRVTNFGFSIPAGSTINGIQVATENQSPNASQLNLMTHLVLGGTVVGTGKSSAAPNAYPATEAFVTFGNSTDLWGATWAASDINSTGFGSQQEATETTGLGSATANVDFVRITVFYTPPAPPGGGKHRTIQTQVRSGAPTRVIGAV